MSDVMIRTSGLSKRFGSVKALDQVDFEVKKGEVVGFLGPNGAGKSTTMRILTCFISPTSGSALVHGFGGVRDTGGHLRVAPRLPTGWRSMRFRLHRRGSDIAIALDADGATVTVETGDPVAVKTASGVRQLAKGGSVRI